MRAPARPRSLRARLVATVVLLLAVAFAVIGVATTFALREFLYNRLDREVVERVPHLLRRQRPFASVRAIQADPHGQKSMQRPFFSQSP